MAARQRLLASAAIAILTVAAGSALASSERPTYDRKIEEAAIRILQGKLGNLRGAFDLKPGDVIAPPEEPASPWEQLTRKPKYARISWR